MVLARSRTPPVLSPPLSANEVDRVLRRAEDDYRAGRLEAAVSGFRRGLQLRPDSADAHIALGLALHGLACNDEAVACLRRATALAPESYEAAYNLGAVLAHQRRPSEAIAAYRAALAINPKAVAAQVNLGLLLKQERRLDEAIECFERAIAIAPHLAAAYAGLGNALDDIGERGAAVVALRRAVELEPRNARWLVNLAQKLEATGDVQGAAATLRSVLAIRPGDVDALAFLPLVLQRLGATGEARRMLDYPQLLRASHLDSLEGWGSPAELNDALAVFACSHPTLQRDPPGKATQNGSQTLEIFGDVAPPMRSLKRFIEAEVSAYMMQVFPAAPFYFPTRPARWDARGWAVVLRSGGYQTAHYHPSGLVSGVYYVQVPEVVLRDNSEAGHIRFGEGPGGRPGVAPEGFLTATVKPEPGLLLLFPSSFWHRTIPFESAEERICIAFDVIASP